jgi:hypothetical protein
MALATALGLGASLALQPLYYQSLQLDRIEQDLTMPALVHAGIWAAVAAPAGMAFGLGLGGRRVRIARAALGGLLGAVVAAVAYEVLGELAFPQAKTIQPMALTWPPRLMARLLLALLAAAGAAALIPRAPAPPDLGARTGG